VDIAATGTRREELLGDAALVAARQELRKRLAGLPPQQAMEALLAQLRRTKTNAELLKR
jgi:transcription termination factor Rho